MTELHDERSAFAPLGDALRDLRAAEATLRAEQHAAWRRYLDEVDRILATDLPSAATKEVDETAHALFEGVRGRLGELRVQAQLGAMEVEDLLAKVRHALTELSGQLHR
jgi:hypothetical protein